MADTQEREMSQEEQDALLDALLKGCSSPKEVLGKHGLLDQLTKRLVERALSAASSIAFARKIAPAFE